MPTLRHGIVVFGDVVDSRREAGRSTAWLRAVTAELDTAFAAERLARFDFTQGDELQGLLALGADPFAVVVRAATHPDALDMRWAFVAGPVDPGRGSATRRTGEAFVAAREALGRARARRDDLLAISGDPEVDALLDDLAPLLAELLAGLSVRQRAVARLVLVEGLRLSEAAERLGVSRATVSVLAERGQVRHIGRLARALAALFALGVARSLPAEAA